MIMIVTATYCKGAGQRDNPTQANVITEGSVDAILSRKMWRYNLNDTI